MDDASLDDFLDTDDSEAVDDGPEDESAVADDSAAVDDETVENGSETDRAVAGDDETATDSDQSADSSSPRVDPGTVEPAAVTSRWDGEGIACASCGERVERAWESTAGLVCPSCKEWS